jgi:hypothetical protein
MHDGVNFFFWKNYPQSMIVVVYALRNQRLAWVGYTPMTNVQSMIRNDRWPRDKTRKKKAFEVKNNDSFSSQNFVKFFKISCHIKSLDVYRKQ